MRPGNGWYNEVNDNVILVADIISDSPQGIKYDKFLFNQLEMKIILKNSVIHQLMMSYL